MTKNDISPDFKSAEEDYRQIGFQVASGTLPSTTEKALEDLVKERESRALAWSREWEKTLEISVRKHILARYQQGKTLPRGWVPLEECEELGRLQRI